jgi:hypothetical protein
MAYIVTEIRVLERRLDKACGGEFVSDFAKDYKTGKARVITIRGYQVGDPVKADRIFRLLTQRKSKLDAQLLEAETFIEAINDSQLRNILTLKYIEGETWEAAAHKTYHRMSGDAARMKVNRYFRKAE